MTEPNVSVWLRAKDLATRTVTRVNRTLKGLTKVGKDVSRSFLAVTGVGTAAVAMISRLSREGSKVSSVMAAFDRAIGHNSQNLEKLRRAARGTISDMELMRQANTAVALGAASTADEVAELVEISQALGRAQGVDASRSLESLSTGIARQSKLYLDNLGILIDVEDAQAKYAKSVGKSTRELTDQEKRIAFRNETLEKARELVDDLATDQDRAAEAGERLATQIQNIRDGFAQWIAQSPRISSFLDGLALVLRDMSGEDLVASAVSASVAMIDDPDVIADRLQDTILELQGVETELAGFEERVRGLGRGSSRDSMLLPGELERLGQLQQRLKDLQSEAGALTRRQMEIARAAGRKNSEKEEEIKTLSEKEIARYLRMSPTAPHEVFDHRTGQSYGIFGKGGPFTPQREGGFDPIPVELVGADRRTIQTHGFLSGGTSAEEIEERNRAMAEAGRVTVASLGAMADVAVRSSATMETRVITAFTNILRATDFGAGLTGTIIGAVGGLFGSLFSRRDPLPVRVRDVDDAAAEKLRTSGDGPDRITVVVEQGGQQIERIERSFYKRRRHDAQFRPSLSQTVFGGG